MPNTEVQETVCPAQSRVEEEFGTSNDVASHGGWGPRTTAAAALTASSTIKMEGWFAAMSANTKTVFTTGEAAKICKVSQQTIIRCFDNGSLKGFRVPGSRFRRIPREALYKFMKDNKIPTDALESGKRKVLLVDDDHELVELMIKVL